MIRSRAALLVGLGLAALEPAAAQEAQRIRTQAAEVVVETVAGGLAHPWGLAFLPDGRMLVTERPGRLRAVTPEGRVSAPLQGLDVAIAARGQGGLLDVALDPRFAENRTLYLSFAEDRGEGRSGSRWWRSWPPMRPWRTSSISPPASRSLWSPSPRS